MIAVKVSQISLSNMGFVVFLKEENGQRSLPIFIGAAEAQAIAFVLEQVNPPRPLTHDLVKKLLDNMECRLKRIEVCDLKDNTFYARLLLEWNGLETEIDSRPSDAIALAMRCAAPIYVANEVMDEAGILVKDEQTSASPGQPPAKPAAKLSPAKLLKQKLDKAVQEERYEDAAKLRDEIKRLTNSN
jgi:bifunctional DNase/RNase